ncbi:hypothetical protein GX51_06492 [Blastomyces parvus]|uniref:CRIB domain-containing protein n=1 Tax=Blastomyces parvus TaxID=2060905 RepID=A0A2B7WQG2_9EURO|nr:hypothetical protein GX51_06492 [Blastomyces parvus]
MFDSVSSAISINTNNNKNSHGKKSIDRNNTLPASISSFSPPPGSQWYNNQSCDHLPPPPMSSPSPVAEPPAVARSRSSTRSPIRLSVFGARSRSNTATSSSSSYRSPASSMTSGDTASRRSSQDGRTPSSSTSVASEKEASTTKSFLSRGSRILRRKGSKFSISSTLTLDEEDEMARGSHSASQRMDGLGIFYRSHRSRHSETHSLKQNISDPFDFQHVTHTSPSQLPPMDGCQLHDIVTEFSVIRASQRPGHELKGIRAESLHFQNFSSDNISTGNDASPSLSDSKSQHAHSRPTSPDVRTSPKSPSRLQSHRNSRSVENFSRPVSRLSRQQSSPSMIAPPRSSSKLATPDIPEPSPQTIDALLGLHSTFAVPETRYDDAQEQHLPKLDLPSVFPDAGHALIPEDDMPVLARSPSNMLAFDLADVPEEDETATSRNNEARNSIVPTSSEPFRFGQSTPRLDFDKPLPAVPAPKELVPEALGSPTIPTLRGDSDEAFSQKKWELNRRRSIFQRPLDDLSWEDDIDYCYEHAAESDSNFDWQRTSFEELEMKTKLERLTIHASPAADTTDTPIAIQIQGSQDGSEHSDQNTINASSFSAPTFTTANYDVSPITATSPLPCVQVDTLSQADYFRDEHVPIMSAPFGDDMVPNQAYHGLIPTDQKVDENYPLYSHAQVGEPFDSPRGSCSPISKCNSQESIILSRAASVARKHRSSLSTTSVPELVHSSNCSHSAVDRDSVSSAGEQHQPQPQQQTKESMPTSTTPSPGPIPRPITTHQRSKSLARELTQRPSPIIDGYTSDISSVPTMPYHDRAKSVSALDLRQPTSPVKAKAPETRKRSATITRGPSGRKARKSYSLFPTAAAAAPAPVAPASR